MTNETGESEGVKATTAEDTSIVTPAPDAPVPQESGGLVGEFLKSLESTRDRYELKNQCRILRDGFFIGETLLHEMLTAFGLFSARTVGGSATVDLKLIRKLLGTEAPTLYYLVEGKVCIPGFIIPTVLPKSDFKIVQEFRGSLINATEFLHPRDPQLATLSGVEVKLDNSGFGVWLKRKDEKIFADSATVQKFYKALTASPKLRKRYPEAGRSLRAALVPLAGLLQQSKPVSNKHLLFIPAQYRGNRNVQFTSVGGFIFVLEQSRLVFSYEVRGGNFRYFVNSELEHIRNSKNRRIGRFEISKRRGAIVGAVQVGGGDKVLIHIETLMQVLELVMRRRTLRKKLKNQVTIFDCLKLISELLQDTIRVEPHEVPHGLLRDHLARVSGNRTGAGKRAPSHQQKKSSSNVRPPAKKGKKKEIAPEDLRYRSGNGWVFFMHDKNTVRGLGERPKPKKSIKPSKIVSSSQGQAIESEKSTG